MKKKIFALIVVLLAAALVALFFVWRGASSRIGQDRALEIALGDAGLTRQEVRDVDVDYEREHGAGVYEVSFEKGAAEYEYSIDAKTGEILFREQDHS